MEKFYEEDLAYDDLTEQEKELFNEFPQDVGFWYTQSGDVVGIAAGDPKAYLPHPSWQPKAEIHTLPPMPMISI